MNNQLKVTFITILLIFIALIIQSTLFEFISINGVKPDLALILLVFISLRKGQRPGQTAGFITGLIEDFLSLPVTLGYYAAIKGIIGFLFGKFKGRMFIGPIFMPVVIILVATFIKYLLAAIFSFFFSVGEPGFFSFRLLIEIIFNCLLAPLVYRFLKLFKVLITAEKETG